MRGLTLLGRVQPQKSFGDEALELHVSDQHFLMKVSGLVDWAALDGYWPTLYGTTGKPSRDPLVLLQDTAAGTVIQPVRSRMRSAMRRPPVLPPLPRPVPDETVLVHFRKRLLKAGLTGLLFAAVLAQIEAAEVIVRRGTLVDATIVRSARQLLERAPARMVYADAAYCDTARRIRFNPRAGELTPRQTALNHHWSKVWAKVEHVFTDWKERRSLARCRMRLKKNALHFTLLAVAHNCDASRCWPHERPGGEQSVRRHETHADHGKNAHPQPPLLQSRQAGCLSFIPEIRVAPASRC
ncbi:transposase [Thiobacillus sp.]